MINWSTEFSVGVREIDEQHNIIVKVADELAQALVNDSEDQQIVGLTIEKLNAFAAYHFATEEKYFAVFKYDGAAEHVATHREMEKRLQTFHQRFAEGHEDIGAELVDFVMKWLSGHIMQMDRKYAECFHQHGLK